MFWRALSVCKTIEFSKLDVNNAFLNGDLLEEIYMSPPPGLRRQGENIVCRLHKSLYGLKQASQQWFSKFTEAVLAAGFFSQKPTIPCSLKETAHLLLSY